LIEVAVLVTDADLVIQGQGLDLIIATDADKLAAMSDFVRDMHTKSGLLNEVRSSSLSMEQAEALIMDYVTDHVPVAGKAPLAGNTIGTDRAFLARDMPTLEGYLHYRNIDVSTIKELARRWYPDAFHRAPKKQSHHRALEDIQESIEELAYYRKTIFGPSSSPGHETLITTGEDQLLA